MIIKFSSRLQPYTDSLPALEISAASVGEALEQAFTQFPDLESALRMNGRLNPFVKIFLNRAEVSREKLNEAALKSGDELYLVGAIAGG